MSKRSILSLAFAALLIPALSSGCASSTERARTEARDSAESFQKSLVELPRKIDATTDKLLSLQSTATTDKAEAFRDFSKALDSQQRAAEDLGKQADAAAADSEEFFRKYVEDAMSGRDPAARKAAMDSISSRKDARDAAMSYIEKARKSYRDLAGSLRDVQNDLRNDLSPAAISKQSPKIQKVVQQAKDVKDYVARLDEQITTALNIKR